MEQALCEKLFSQWPEPRLLITRGADGAFLVEAANTPALEYFLPKGATLDGVYIGTHLDAGNREHVLKAFQVCWASAVPITVQVVPLTPTGVRIRSFFLNPIKDDAGNCVAVDMSARLPAHNEASLRRERDDAMSIFASIFDASDIGIMVTDHHRRIVRINETFCNLYGWAAIDLIGQEFVKIIPPEDRAARRARHDTFLSGDNTERSREIQILRADGTVADVISSSGVIELSGARKFRISTVVDITDMKQIQADLRAAKDEADAANRAKSSFLANMSHELRTPLNAIIGFSEMMISGIYGPIGSDRYAEYLEDIRFSATHLLDIINDVLDMSKIEAGQMNLERTKTCLADLLQDAARLIQARADASNVTLDLQVPEKLPCLQLDQRMIRQVILNLLSNAVKFSHAGGKVSVYASVLSSGFVELRVTDTGIGIPKDKIAEVMRPFGQVYDPRINASQGTGLGLPLARTMVEMHGGTLNIASTPDIGTCVTFTLPLSDEPTLPKTKS